MFVPLISRMRFRSAEGHRRRSQPSRGFGTETKTEHASGVQGCGV